jgi:hypothetical protein
MLSSSYMPRFSSPPLVKWKTRRAKTKIFVFTAPLRNPLLLGAMAPTENFVVCGNNEESLFGRAAHLSLTH